MTTGAKLFLGSIGLGIVYAVAKMPSISLISQGDKSMKVKFKIDGTATVLEFFENKGLQAIADPKTKTVFICSPLPEDNGMSFHIGIDFNPEDGTYKVIDSKFFEYIGTSIGSEKIRAKKSKPNKSFEIVDSGRNIEQANQIAEIFTRDSIPVYIHDNGNNEGELKYDIYINRFHPLAKYYV